MTDETDLDNKIARLFATARSVSETAEAILGERDAARAQAERWDTEAAASKAVIKRLEDEVASLRLTLGGRTFSDQPVPDPVGCPLPGACVQVAEITRLREALKEIWHNRPQSVFLSEADLWNELDRVYDIAINSMLTTNSMLKEPTP